MRVVSRYDRSSRVDLPFTVRFRVATCLAGQRLVDWANDRLLQRNRPEVFIGSIDEVTGEVTGYASRSFLGAWRNDRNVVNTEWWLEGGGETSP